MSLDPPPYLSSLQNNIRTRPIPWDGAVRARTISDDQLSKIRAVDKVRRDQRKQVIENDIDGYRTLFVGGQGNPSILESAAKRADVVQYVLVLLGDLLEGRYSPPVSTVQLMVCVQITRCWVKPSQSTQILTRHIYLYSNNPLIPKVLYLYSHPPYSRA
jgi:hypothetical protein